MNANLIVIGGPISVGKSTLISSLGYPQVPELDESDLVQMLLLENTYKKGRVAPEVIEHYFLQVRKEKYIKYSNSLQTHILDRSIFESLWFAKGNMNHKSFFHFKKLWKNEIIGLINEVGKPKLYILLTMSWEVFKERFFSRGREVEIKNFNENEEFFKKHIAEYEKHMIEVFELFDIEYKKINTDNLTTKQVKEDTIQKINEVLNA